LAVSQPAIALPLAFLSHFALDAVPHWHPKQADKRWLKSSNFQKLLMAEATLCFLIVLFLFLIKPRHWLVAVVCAFLAASPDLFWLKKFLVVRRTGRLLPNKNWFWYLHGVLQWFQRPIGAVIEIVWLMAMLIFVGILV
ncbi:MAG: hypothetical protein ACREGF_04355, partial [Candidatus Saccharimonadales bacterium]